MPTSVLKLQRKHFITIVKTRILAQIHNLLFTLPLYIVNIGSMLFIMMLSICSAWRVSAISIYRYSGCFDIYLDDDSKHNDVCDLRMKPIKKLRNILSTTVNVQHWS